MARPRNVCDGCGQSLDRRRREHVVLGPIVHTRVWRRLADDPREQLCLACMDRRATERLRLGGLALNDLRLCRWNLEWLDVFVDADDGKVTPLQPMVSLSREIFNDYGDWYESF
jgi:hypothetical protein